MTTRRHTALAGRRSTGHAARCLAAALLAVVATGCTKDVVMPTTASQRTTGVRLSGVRDADEIVTRLADYEGPYRLESRGDATASFEGPQDLVTLGARAPQLGSEVRDASGRVRSTTTGPYGRTVVFDAHRCWGTRTADPSAVADGVWHLRRLQTAAQGNAYQHWSTMQTFFELLPDRGQADTVGEVRDTLKVDGRTLTVTRTHVDKGEVDTVVFHLDARGVPTEVVSTRDGFGPVTTTLTWDLPKVQLPTGAALGADKELCRTNVPDVAPLTSTQAATEMANLLMLSASHQDGTAATPSELRPHLDDAVPNFPGATFTPASDFASSGRVTVDADGSPVCLVVPAQGGQEPVVTVGACR